MRTRKRSKKKGINVKKKEGKKKEPWLSARLAWDQRAYYVYVRRSTTGSSDPTDRLECNVTAYIYNVHGARLLTSSQVSHATSTSPRTIFIPLRPASGLSACLAIFIYLFSSFTLVTILLLVVYSLFFIRKFLFFFSFSRLKIFLDFFFLFSPHFLSLFLRFAFYHFIFPPPLFIIVV